MLNERSWPEFTSRLMIVKIPGFIVKDVAGLRLVSGWPALPYHTALPPQQEAAPKVADHACAPTCRLSHHSTRASHSDGHSERTEHGTWRPFQRLQRACGPGQAGTNALWHQDPMGEAFCPPPRPSVQDLPRVNAVCGKSKGGGCGQRIASHPSPGRCTHFTFPLCLDIG